MINRSALFGGLFLSTIPVLSGVAIPNACAADPAPFDLAGPSLNVSVTRAGVTLPIGQVPNLATGDALEIRAALPEDQAAEYLLISAFLHGATNPPPKAWIDSAKTWKRKEKDRLLKIVVPDGARQLALFMVPATGGDYGTISDAVRGKPGEFVRVTQDLNQASLDRSRLNAFMAGIRAQENTHPEYLRTLAPALASSLSIKLNADCLAKVVELQAACLLENRDSLVLSDVHSASLADTLTGTPADLAFQISATREAGYGYYSAYIGVARDLARIFGAFNSPEFQYLPALAVQDDDRVSLLLNTAPSFRKPKSVLVAAMPAIEAGSPPPLRAANDAPICATRPGMILSVEGAPLIYSTGYARDMALRIKTKDGRTIDVPVSARADKGGYAITADGLRRADFDSSTPARLHGFWGFAPFDGPRFTLQFSQNSSWRTAEDAPTLIVGRDNALSLRGPAASCIENVSVQEPGARPKPAEWKATGPEAISVNLPLAAARPGKVVLTVKHYGIAEPTSIAVEAYAEASRLDSLVLHAGDAWAVLTGRRLDQIASIDLDGTAFHPGELTREGDVDKLRIVAQDTGKAAKMTKGEGHTARLTLKDGRIVTLPVTVAASRPGAVLLAKSIERKSDSTGIPIISANPDMLPDDARLTVSVRTVEGTHFTAADSLEIATEDGSASIRLSSAKGFRLESAQIAIATFDPATLGASAFGPLRFRLVQSEAAGDWRPLATLVRIPTIRSVTCLPESQSCRLTGSNLFLIDSVASAPGFERPAIVPSGFTDAALDVPLPVQGKLYVKLRDAPDAVYVLTVSPPVG